MTALGWVLIAAIVLVVAIYVIALIRVGREGPITKYSTYQILSIGLLFILYLALKSRDIEPADWAQILLMFGLVAVTIFYAWSASRQAKASEKMAEATKEQADANVKMATEMQNQRYDTFRPVLDIHMDRVSLIGTEPTTNTDDLPIRIDYQINNIGVGPALDGHLWTPEHNRIDLGTLTTIRDSDATGDDRRGRINIEKDKLPATIIAYYKDVFSRSFKSEMEICLAIEENAVTFGTLKHRKLDREKDSDLIESIWSPSKEEVNQND